MDEVPGSQSFSKPTHFLTIVGHECRNRNEYYGAVRPVRESIDSKPPRPTAVTSDLKRSINA
jgi:hypothetical protein